MLGFKERSRLKYKSRYKYVRAYNTQDAIECLLVCFEASKLDRLGDCGGDWTV